MTKFYITNAIPYVNSKPHIGHALEFIQSDTIARYHKYILGDETYLSCGYDENSLKNVQAAEAEGISVQELVDKNGKLFFDLWEKLRIQFDQAIKGSDPKHISSSQKLWNLCAKNGDIYKKSYEGLYCVGCEQFYEKNELNEKGECFEHPGKPLEKVSEENYFFKLSDYTDRILQLIESDELQIIPETRKNEVVEFVKKGLEDISISRTNERAKNWGVPVPEDEKQKMYVWFDALNIYQTAAGFGWNEETYKKLWPADLHVVGKGIIRFHAVYWPAFLLSAGLKLPKKIFVHEYFTVDGQKMSKTLGNVIDPLELVEKYSAEGLRYYCLAKFSPFQDGDFSEERFKETYNADLANGLGNLVARVARLCEKIELDPLAQPQASKNYKKIFSTYKFNDVLGDIWSKISEIDQEIEREQPWKIEDLSKLKAVLQDWVERINQISFELKPFLPETSEKIQNLFGQTKIKSIPPLFPRI